MYRQTSNYSVYEVESGQSVDYIIELGKSVSDIAKTDKSIVYRQNATFAWVDKGIYKPIGFVIKDGKVIQSTSSASKWGAFVIPKNGRPYIGQIDPSNVSSLKLAFQSTPQILKNGVYDYSFQLLEGTPEDVKRSVKRSAIGVKSDGTVVLVTTIAEYTLPQLADLMKSLGCIEALNLDGGGSVTKNYNNEPHGFERPVSAAIVIRQKEVNKVMLYVAFDAGHGSDTYKKTGSKGVPTMEEHEFNAAVVGYAKELAEFNGFKVLLTQPLNQPDVPLKQRTDKANAEKVDLLISFHADAGAPTAKGHTAFYWHNSEDSKRLATIWDKYADQIMKNGDRNIKSCVPNTDTDFHMVRETKMTAILCEHGFMTNAEELALLKSDEFRRKCAEVAVRTICEYFGKTFNKPEDILPKVPTETTKQTPKTDVELENALKVLQSNGIIQTPDYWLKNAVTGGQVNGEYAAILIKNLANKLRELIAQQPVPTPPPTPQQPKPEEPKKPEPQTPQPQPSPSRQPLTWEQVEKLATETSVYIQSGLAHGTGVLLKDGYILTAKHVTGGRELVGIKTKNNKQLNAYIVESHPTADLILYRLVGDSKDLLNLKISAQSVVSNQELLTVGHPKNKTWDMKRGAVCRVQIPSQPWEFDHSVPVESGNSGGALVDQFGEVVGIVVQSTSVNVMKNGVFELVQGGEAINVNHPIIKDWLNKFIK